MALEKTDVRFDERGLIPVVVQDAKTNDVLMVAYMNEEALNKTIETGTTWFYSRSRRRLWQKGESSGHVQKVQDIVVDCDGDTLLVRVDQLGPGACHKGYRSCFHTVLKHMDGEPQSEARPTFDPETVYGRRETSPQVIDELVQVIADRKKRPRDGSYTTYLFSEGIDKILKKVGEESAEVLIAAKGGDREGLVMESADLLYHLLVLFVEEGIPTEELWHELNKRRGGGGSEDAPPGK